MASFGSATCGEVVCLTVNGGDAESLFVLEGAVKHAVSSKHFARWYC